jgi:hypothetical protein
VHEVANVFVCSSHIPYMYLRHALVAQEVAAKNGSARLFHGDVVSDESAGTQPNTRAANKRPPKGKVPSQRTSSIEQQPRLVLQERPCRIKRGFRDSTPLHVRI